MIAQRFSKWNFGRRMSALNVAGKFRRLWHREAQVEADADDNNAEKIGHAPDAYALLCVGTFSCNLEWY